MSTAELHHEIQVHRDELAQTVDALAAKLDVRPKLSAAARRAALPLGGLVAFFVALKLWKRHRS